MDKVDRLLIQVRRAFGEHTKQVSQGFVDVVGSGENKGKFRSTAVLWDGYTTSPTEKVISYHDSIDEALKAIEAVAEIHKPPVGYKTIQQEVPVLICEWGDLDEVAS
jgi:hypothetical protein